MIPVTPTIAAPRPRVAQPPAEWLRRRDGLLGRASAEIQAVFPRRGLKRIRHLGWAHYHGLSRARNGDASSPLYRLSVWLLALLATGAPRADAQRLVDFLQSLVDAWWAGGCADLLALAQREQEIDAREDIEEVAYLCGREGARERWLGFLRQRRAHDAELIVALELQAGLAGVAA